jgi:hypothetical protein
MVKKFCWQRLNNRADIGASPEAGSAASAIKNTQYQKGGDKHDMILK